MTVLPRPDLAAPSGLYQIVHVDPRDHEHSKNGPPTTGTGVIEIIGRMMYAEFEVTKVFDDTGHALTTKELEALNM